MYEDLTIYLEIFLSLSLYVPRMGIAMTISF